MKGEARLRGGLAREMLNLRRVEANEEWQLDVIAKHMHLRRNLDTVSVSEGLQQSSRAADGHFDGSRIINQGKGRCSTGSP